MANITLLGASYEDVPAVELPQTGGGKVTFWESLPASSQAIRTGTSAPSSSLGDDGDVYIQADAGGSVEAYPADYEASGLESSSNAGRCIGVSAADGSATGNVYASGSSGSVNYSFDLSGIPANANITGVECVVRAHEENASRSTFTLQLYAGDTAKGSRTTVSGTSNANYTLDAGSWTRAELDSLILHTTYGYYGGLVAGATLTITYTMDSASYDVTLTGSSSGWSITGSGIYQKSGGAWSQVSSVALDDIIERK